MLCGAREESKSVLRPKSAILRLKSAILKCFGKVKVSVNALEEFGRQEQQGTTIAQKIKQHFDEQHKPCPVAFDNALHATEHIANV